MKDDLHCERCEEKVTEPVKIIPEWDIHFKWGNRTDIIFKPAKRIDFVAMGLAISIFVVIYLV
jgi:hypothetical protein